MSLTTANIRNIALVGHGGTGKTSLLEQMLYNGGVIPKAELPDTGKSVSDYTSEEIDHKMSIHSALAEMQWKNSQLNILDTPGVADFVGEVVASYRASESAILLVGARSSVQIETIKLWRRLNNRKMPRIIFINKLDKERADFEQTYADLNSRFDKTFVPVTIPMGTGENYKGIVNLIENKAYFIHDTGKNDEPSDIPENMKEAVEKYRQTLIETAAEGDDDLLEKYFEEGTLSTEDIRLGLKEGVRNYKIVPILCGSALKNNGIASLLNFIDTAAPSPDLYKEKAVDNDEGEIEVPISSQDPYSSFVFKTSIDQFSGKLSYIKVVSGILTPGMEVINFKESKKEKISKIYRTVGKKLVEAKELVAGDIGILAKQDSVHTNDSLCDPARPLNFKQLSLPHPIHSLAVSAASKKAEDKLNEFIHRAAEEDLTFTVNFNTETKENVISGMGELHINIILDKIKDKQNIEVETRIPKVAYRETITKSAEAEYTHKKQSGGHGQYGRVLLKVQPLQRGEFFIFENAIKGGSISKGYMPGIEKGILEGMSEGYLAGYPIVDLKAVVVDGKEHPVDSSEMAFKLAGKGALKEALAKANPVLLEPVMKLSVYIEEQYLGDILSDLSSKRGRVSGQDNLGGGIIEVNATVPQAEMLRYAIDLKSLTSGTGSFDMEFDHYEGISGKIADAVITAAKKAKEGE